MYARSSVVLSHIGIATRTSSGQATAGIQCGSYIDGQLIIYVASMAAGGRVTPYWQSSSDGIRWGDLARGATMSATGVRIVSLSGGIGSWTRARWVLAGSTGVKFSGVFQFKD
jgi:hypothetical protein